MTTKDPDSGPVPGFGDIVTVGDIDSSGQYWRVYILSDSCTAWHKEQERKLHWVLDYSAGNTFGCQVSGTGELHLHHNGRDVGVAWEGLPTDQPLWGFVILPGFKVEANYIIAQSEATCVCVSLHVQLATEVEGVNLHVYSSIHSTVSPFTSCQCQLLQPISVGYMHAVHLLQATPRTMLARPSTLWRGPLSGWSVQCVRH